MSVVLDLRGIDKTYPGANAAALTGVNLSVRAGEIHALVGENGAGKTTLAMIAAGFLAPSGGTRELRGSVGLVHQHSVLVDRLRVWENIVLGAEPRRGVGLDERRARERVRELCARSGLEVDPNAVVEELPVGIAQRVELLREFAREPTVLLLDEPTAVLAPAEIDAFFATVHALAEQGIGVLIITHKLQEVLSHASRATVLRGGVVVAEFQTARSSIEEIAHAMVGGTLPDLSPRGETVAVPMLAVHDLRAGAGAHALQGVEFEVRAGEIVGIAGVEGNGQSALADAIAGVGTYAGTMTFAGRALTPLEPAVRAAAGIRVIPQDRQREALVLTWSIAENVVLGDHRRAFAKGGRLDREATAARAREIVERFDVRAGSIQALVGRLSGGNQQKIVVGRALAGKPRFVLAYQPTRGIDAGAATLVQSRLMEARNAGVAILLISFELDELFALADRVLVLYRGRIVGAFTRAAFDRARIGALMAGAA
jgi:general nucleoside transport system ATP-binding protein